MEQNQVLQEDDAASGGDSIDELFEDKKPRKR